MPSLVSERKVRVLNKMKIKTGSFVSKKTKKAEGTEAEGGRRKEDVRFLYSETLFVQSLFQEKAPQWLRGTPACRQTAQLSRNGGWVSMEEFINKPARISGDFSIL